MARTDISLKTFKASFNGVQENGHLPARLKLFDWGLNKTNQGNFVVDDETFKVFGENQTKLARNSIQVDFNHNTVSGTDAFKAAAGSPEIAGYGVPVIVKGEGIFLDGIITTPSGIRKSGDYQDLSPTPLVDDQGRVLALHSVALCPAGSVEGLTLESAALKALSAQLVTLSVPDSKICGPDDIKQPDAYTKSGALDPYKTMEAEHFSLIKKVMGMPEDMSYEDFIEKTKATAEGKLGDKGAGPITGANSQIMPFASDIDQANAGMKMLEAKLESIFESKLKPLTAELTLVKGQLDAEKVKAIESQRNSLIAQAGKDGKVIPLSADQIKTVDLPILESIISNLKPVVPLRATTRPLSADNKPAELTKRTLNDSSAAINAQIAKSYGLEATRLN